MSEKIFEPFDPIFFWLEHSKEQPAIFSTFDCDRFRHLLSDNLSSGGAGLAIGFILFIIPGIFLALNYLFYGYLIVDRGLGSIQSLRESGRMTNGAKKI